MKSFLELIFTLSLLRNPSTTTALYDLVISLLIYNKWTLSWLGLCDLQSIFGYVHLYNNMLNRNIYNASVEFLSSKFRHSFLGPNTIFNVVLMAQEWVLLCGLMLKQWYDTKIKYCESRIHFFLIFLKISTLKEGPVFLGCTLMPQGPWGETLFLFCNSISLPVVYFI